MVCDKDNPFSAKLKFRTRLTAPNSSKDVRHLVFDLKGSDIAYKCGDSLAVFPKNNIVTVAKILDLLKIQPSTEVELPQLDKKVSAFEALHEYLCITFLSREFLSWFSQYIVEDEGISFFENEVLCDDETCHVMAKSYSLLEILKKFKVSQNFDPNEFFPKLRRLHPRLYSIASSPLVHPNEAHIVVSVVSYMNFIGNQRHGIASSYLANDMNLNSDTANVFVIKSLFSLPTEVSRDVIMVGPGTGVAPFIGFLQERMHLRNLGHKVGKNWLFFGDRHRESDFLFKRELLDYQSSGILTNLNLAFSRDQSHKMYVQDRMWENREKLWKWISNGAYIYVCGEAKHMAVDVDNMLKKIAMESGSMDADQANDFFRTLRKVRRYQRDVY